jgi:hypothetical protein
VATAGKIVVFRRQKIVYELETEDVGEIQSLHLMGDFILSVDNRVRIWNHCTQGSIS